MLTAREAAQVIGAAESSVRLWARKGRFPGAELKESPVGSYWIIPEDALEGFEMKKPGPKPKSKSTKKGKTK